MIWFVCCSDIPKNDGYSKYLKFVTPFCYFLTSLNPPSPSAPPCNELKMPIPGAARSAAARLLGLRVRIPPVAWMSVVRVVCSQRSLRRADLSSRGVLQSVECDHEASIMRGPWPTGGVLRHDKRPFLNFNISSRHNDSINIHTVYTAIIQDFLRT